MKIYCACCGKQLVDYHVSNHDSRVTIPNGSKPMISPTERICGYCAKDLDKDGCFPEEVGKE